MKNKLAILGTFLIMMTIGSGCTGPVTSQPDVNKTWLQPGKIQINKYSPGKKVVHQISVHNGKNVETGFSVYYRIPDYVEDGFVTAPDNAYKWIAISESAPILKAHETKEIEITLNLPETTQTPDQWEFWIGVKENTGSSVLSELCSRWLVSMKGK
jgi:hypothetical protein